MEIHTNKIKTGFPENVKNFMLPVLIAISIGR